MVLVVTKSSLLKYVNISCTNYVVIALNNFSFPSFPKSDQTPVLQDKAECASAGQVFNGFVLSRETLTVLLDLLRSERQQWWCAMIQTLVFLFCLPAVHHTDGLQSVWHVPRSTVTALSSESLRRCWPFTKRLTSWRPQNTWRQGRAQTDAVFWC